MIPNEMIPNEAATLVAYGVLLAVVVRWLFDLDVGFMFAATVGVLSVLATPWVNTMADLGTLSSFQGSMVGGVLTAVVLGITQLLRSY